ncbi:hypothetical protein [Azotobacter beijerinckii]|uniref:hypothetical protein n=1 Tax=Azotobacter beijerinckii TaxID=170623 RepID=UPI001113482A|nr:hypothetical protein [Azotobacter beijerinckii]
MAINLATSTCLVLLVLAKQSVLWISGNSSGPNGKVNPESKTNSHKSAESFCHQPVPGNAKPNTPIAARHQITDSRPCWLATCQAHSGESQKGMKNQTLSRQKRLLDSLPKEAKASRPGRKKKHIRMISIYFL